MQIYVGLTEKHWYEQLSSDSFDEVNFWNSGSRGINLNDNDIFLFKLHSPDDMIVGGAFFVRYVKLSPLLAWKAFEKENGATSYEEFLYRISRQRGIDRITSETQIGCIVLANPFWFKKEDWFSAPEWKRQIQSGRKYDTETEIGRQLYNDVIARIGNQTIHTEDAGNRVPEENRFVEVRVNRRLGQGAFRLEVADAYNNSCAITGVKASPVLEAAHIRAYSQNGPHHITNGILLRTDIHALFDSGYITITPDYHVKVSNHLQSKYGDGEYMQYDGRKLLLPRQNSLYPNAEYIRWHNENVFLGD